jgi:D-alanyl-D-alanine carboxypeptidase
MPLHCPTNLARRRLIFSTLAGATLTACGGGSTEPAKTTVTEAESNTLPPESPTESASAFRPLSPIQAAAQAAVSTGLVSAALASVEVTPQTSALGAFGVCQKGGKLKVNIASTYNIASLTKAMSASVIASVVEQGLLNWDTRVADALPELADSMNPAYANVTLEQLLAHQGGILAIDGLDGDMKTFLANLPAELPTTTETLSGKRRYFAAWLLQQQPPQDIVPGRDFHYSNAGYTLAATMAEAVTGQSFEALFEAIITTQLGVKGHWRMTSQTIPNDQPVGHTGQASALQAYTPQEQDTTAEPWLRTIAPAGYWACSTLDYAQWLRWHVQALRGQTTPLPAPYVQRLAALESGQYFSGWGCGLLNNTKVLEHMGCVEGFMSRVCLDAQGLHCAFGLSNTSDIDENGNSWVWASLAQSINQIYPGYTASPGPIRGRPRARRQSSNI